MIKFAGMEGGRDYGSINFCPRKAKMGITTIMMGKKVQNWQVCMWGIDY